MEGAGGAKIFSSIQICVGMARVHIQLYNWPNQLTSCFYFLVHVSILLTYSVTCPLSPFGGLHAIDGTELYVLYLVALLKITASKTFITAYNMC